MNTPEQKKEDLKNNIESYLESDLLQGIDPLQYGYVQNDSLMIARYTLKLLIDLIKRVELLEKVATNKK